MKLYEALDMNGIPIKNCPSASIIEILKVDGVTKVTIKRSVDGEEQVVEIKDGAKGDKGEDGRGITILGSYENDDALNAAHPTGTLGQGYLVAGNLMVWSETTNAWENVGRIQGPEGDIGPKGEDGKSLTFDDLTEAQKEALTGKAGTSVTAYVEPYNDTDADISGHKVTMYNDGVAGDSFIVKDGKQGKAGVGIAKVEKTATTGNTITYTMTLTDGRTFSFDVTNGSDATVAKTSQLENDSGFVTTAVENLANYYTKDQTLTEEEINELIAAKSNGKRVILGDGQFDPTERVPTIPADSIDPDNTYLVPSTSGKGYIMYAWISNKWCVLGETNEINLDNYYTMGQVDNKLLNYYTQSQIDGKLTPLATKAALNEALGNIDYNTLKNLPSIPDTSGLATDASVDAKIAPISTAIEGKADKGDLTTHINHGAIHVTADDKAKWNEKQDKLTIDALLSDTSSNPIQNKVLYAKFDEIQRQLTYLNAAIASIPVGGLNNTQGVEISSENTLTSDFTVDMTKNFEIVVQFSYDIEGVRYILFGDYPKGSLNVELVTRFGKNFLRTWTGVGQTNGWDSTGDMSENADGTFNTPGSATSGIVVNKNTCNTPVTTGTKHTVKVTWNKTTKKLLTYLDNVLIGDITINNTALNTLKSPAPMKIGSDYRTTFNTTMKYYQVSAKFV